MVLLLSKKSIKRMLLFLKLYPRYSFTYILLISIIIMKSQCSTGRLYDKYNSNMSINII